LNKWKKFFNQVLNIYGVRDVRQIVISMAEPLVPAASLAEAEIAIADLKIYKFQGTAQIPSEFIKAALKHSVLRQTNLFVLHGMRRNFHKSGRNLLFFQLIKRQKE
jgi:hypothetical protein